MEKSNDWKYGLFCSFTAFDLPELVKLCLGLPLYYIKSLQQLSDNPNGLKLLLFPLNRKRLRHKRLIQGNIFKDTVTYCFCAPCAMMQEIAEIELIVNPTQQKTVSFSEQNIRLVGKSCDIDVENISSDDSSLDDSDSDSSTTDTSSDDATSDDESSTNESSDYSTHASTCISTDSSSYATAKSQDTVAKKWRKSFRQMKTESAKRAQHINLRKPAKSKSNKYSAHHNGKPRLKIGNSRLLQSEELKRQRTQQSLDIKNRNKKSYGTRKNKGILSRLRK